VANATENESGLDLEEESDFRPLLEYLNNIISSMKDHKLSNPDHKKAFIIDFSEMVFDEKALNENTTNVLVRLLSTILSYDSRYVDEIAIGAQQKVILLQRNGSTLATSSNLIT
jgi:predicted regulator of Ras-like GTPase activity (Roadblock/LC7/MglB family)